MKREPDEQELGGGLPPDGDRPGAGSVRPGARRRSWAGALDTALQDLRFAVRQLARQPGFTLTALLSLGLGIGATTTIFTAAEVMLHRPLPFEHAERLVRVYRIPAAGTPRISLRPETYTSVETRGRFFDRIVAQRYTSLVRQTEAGPERVVGIAVTAGWAETLGVRPHLGRSFSDEEERSGDDSGVVLLSHGAWERWFGGAEDVLGAQIVLDGRPYAVVGVMQPGLRYPYDADLWLPLSVGDAQVGPWSFNALARLRPGTTVEDARSDLGRVAREAVAAGESPNLAADGMSLTAVPFRELFVQDEARLTLVLLGGVAFLLLIVCANVANLLLARGLNRGRELAVRTSVGASRERIFRQLLTESLVLGAAGSALGILLASFGSTAVRPLLPADFGYVGTSLTINGPVMAFAVGLALACVLAFGLVPALRISRVGAGIGAFSGSRGTDDPSIRRLSAGVATAEIALGVVLVSGAWLILQDLQRQTRVDLGYDPAGLVTFSLSLSGDPWDDPTARVGLVDRAAEELTRIAGVSGAGVTSMFPSTSGNALAQVEIEGRDEPPGTQRLVNHRLVGPSYFDALGVQVLDGRGITEQDRPDALPVVVISARMADRFWPGEDPIGRRVRSRSGEDAPWMTVVGVVEDVREFWDVDETWYLPFAQHAQERSASSVTVVVRGAEGLPDSRVIRGQMAGIAPELPVVDLASARQIHEESLSRERQAGVLGAAFAGFGLLLAAMGIYGSVSFDVGRRTREFGVRMALGGQPGAILWSVLGDAARLVAVGGALGAVGALLTGRLLAGVLSEVPGPDPYSIAGAVLFLGATALAAVAMPARRAARVDPMTALRQDA